MSIVVDERGKCLLIRFADPRLRNPLSSSVIDRLHSILDDRRTESVATSVVFSGENRVFASGADLREIAELNSDTAREFARKGQSLMTKISMLPIKTIAAINGYCFGGGLDLALACGRRIASPEAVFCHPGTSLGIITGWGGTQRLPRLIGESNALEMFMTAGRFDAAWALRAGLVDEVVDDPLGRALELET